MDQIKKEKIRKEAEEQAHREIAEEEMKKQRSISSFIAQKHGNNQTNSTVIA